MLKKLAGGGGDRRARGGRGRRRPLPVFKVAMQFSGLSTTAWVTDTGEIVREESPMGLITVRESQDEATALAVNRQMQVDMLKAVGGGARDDPGPEDR